MAGDALLASLVLGQVRPAVQLADRQAMAHQAGLISRYPALIKSNQFPVATHPFCLAAWQLGCQASVAHRYSAGQASNGVAPRVCPATPSRSQKTRLMKASHDSSVTLIWQTQSHALSAAMVKPTVLRLHFTKQGSAQAVCVRARGQVMPGSLICCM